MVAKRVAQKPRARRWRVAWRWPRGVRRRWAAECSAGKAREAVRKGLDCRALLRKREVMSRLLLRKCIRTGDAMSYFRVPRAPKARTTTPRPLPSRCAPLARSLRFTLKAAVPAAHALHAIDLHPLIPAPTDPRSKWITQLNLALTASTYGLAASVALSMYGPAFSTHIAPNSFVFATASCAYGPAFSRHIAPNSLDFS